MNLIQILDLKSGISFGVFLFVLLLTIIQIAPIKINPWDKILVWFGNHMNADIVRRVDVIEEKLDEEFKKCIIDFSKEKLPQIYRLLDKYKGDTNIIIFKTREEADNYIRENSEKWKIYWIKI